MLVVSRVESGRARMAVFTRCGCTDKNAEFDCTVDCTHGPFDLHDALVGAGAQGRKSWREPILQSLTELSREEMAKELGL